MDPGDLFHSAMEMPDLQHGAWEGQREAEGGCSYVAAMWSTCTAYIILYGFVV